ncbi:MAG: hypothetical protein WC635_17120 [Bacteriovorax sp.]
MLDNKQIESNWPTIKSHVLSHWRRLSESDVEKTHGDTNSLGKLIEESYGAKEDFDMEYERLVISVVNTASSIHSPNTPRKHTSEASADSIMSESAMDKDRDDTYLSGPYGVTRRTESYTMRNLTKKSLEKEGFNEEGADGFHNLDRSSKRSIGEDPGHKMEEELLQPDLQGMEATEAFITPTIGIAPSIQHKNRKIKHKNKKQASDEFKTNQVPRRNEGDITLGRSNSSANTTSQSAQTSSEAMSKNTKKL